MIPCPVGARGCGEIAQVGLARCLNHHYSLDGQGGYPGVTSIIKVLDKSAALVGWAKRETAACAVRNLPMLSQMVATGGPEAAVRWLKEIPDYQRDQAADLGTRVHAIAEALAHKQPIVISPDIAPRVDAYQRWLHDAKVEVVVSEGMVISLRHRYGGTGDLWAKLGGRLWLIDIKTGAGVYPEHDLQLAALRYAPSSLRPWSCGLLHLRNDQAELIERPISRETFAAFLAARRLRAWVDAQPRLGGFR